MQKRQHISGGLARQGASGCPNNAVKASSEWTEKGLQLFDAGIDLFQADLELPIKIETRNFSRKRRSRRQSDSISEDLQQLLKDEERADPPDFEELLPAQRTYDPIEELLLPLQELEGRFSQSSSEVPGLEHLTENPIDKLKAEEAGNLMNERGKEEWNERRNALLKVINNFKAYCQAISVVFNFHQLMKKDKVTKMQKSMMDVLSRENAKMQDSLFQELRIASVMRANLEEELGRRAKEELLQTMPDEKLVKEEYIE